MADGFDLDAVRQRQARARAEIAEVVDLDADRTPEAKLAAIAACGMCDSDGYRGLAVCDHQDHSAAAARGMAAINEILGRKR